MEMLFPTRICIYSILQLFCTHLHDDDDANRKKEEVISKIVHTESVQRQISKSTFYFLLFFSVAAAGFASFSAFSLAFLARAPKWRACRRA